MAGGASVSSLSADETIQASENSPLPTGHVLPKAMDIALSLIKPAGTFAKAADAFSGGPKLTAGMEVEA